MTMSLKQEDDDVTEEQPKFILERCLPCVRAARGPSRCWPAPQSTKWREAPRAHLATSSSLGAAALSSAKATENQECALCQLTAPCVWQQRVR